MTRLLVFSLLLTTSLHAVDKKQCDAFFGMSSNPIKAIEIPESKIDDHIEALIKKHSDLFEYVEGFYHLVRDFKENFIHSPFEFKYEVFKVFEEVISKFLTFSRVDQYLKDMREQLYALSEANYSIEVKRKVATNKQVVRFLSRDLPNEFKSEFEYFEYLSLITWGYIKANALLDFTESNLSRYFADENVSPQYINSILQNQLQSKIFRKNYRHFLSETMISIMTISSALDAGKYFKHRELMIKDLKKSLDQRAKELKYHQSMIYATMLEYLFQKGRTIDMQNFELRLGELVFQVVDGAEVVVKSSAKLSAATNGEPQTVILHAPMYLISKKKKSVLILDLPHEVSMDIFW